MPVTFVAVLVALALTGTLGARLGGARKRRAALRVVVGGALAMAVTFGIGALLGVVVGTALGVAVARALRDEGISELALPWPFLAAYLLAGAAIGVAAAVLPAIRTARVDVLRAISYE